MTGFMEPQRSSTTLALLTAADAMSSPDVSLAVTLPPAGLLIRRLFFRGDDIILSSSVAGLTQVIALALVAFI